MKEKDYDLNDEIDRFIRAVIDNVEQGKASPSEAAALPEIIKIKLEYL